MTSSPEISSLISSLQVLSELLDLHYTKVNEAKGFCTGNYKIANDFDNEYNLRHHYSIVIGDMESRGSYDHSRHLDHSVDLLSGKEVKSSDLIDEDNGSKLASSINELRNIETLTPKAERRQTNEAAYSKLIELDINVVRDAIRKQATEISTLLEGAAGKQYNEMIEALAKNEKDQHTEETKREEQKNAGYAENLGRNSDSLLKRIRGEVVDGRSKKRAIG